MVKVALRTIRSRPQKTHVGGRTQLSLVGALDSPDMFQSIIDQIGRDHARFGVTPSHLTAFGDALLWTWEQHFGSAFTPEVREAWTRLYEAVRSDMLRAIEADRGRGPERTSTAERFKA